MIDHFGLINNRPGQPENVLDQIADDQIGVQHLNVGAGAVQRFIVLDANGDATARQIGLDDLVKTSQTLPSNARAALTSVDGLSLSEFSKLPSANVPMNARRITGLGTPVDIQDAATKAYVDGAIGGMQFSTGTITGADLNGGGSIDINCGFTPDLFIIMGRRENSTGEGSWVWTRGSVANADVVAHFPNGYTGNLRITTPSTNVIRLLNNAGVNDYSATWRWFAAKV